MVTSAPGRLWKQCERPALKTGWQVQSGTGPYLFLSQDGSREKAVTALSYMKTGYPKATAGSCLFLYCQERSVHLPPLHLHSTFCIIRQERPVLYLRGVLHWR